MFTIVEQEAPPGKCPDRALFDVIGGLLHHVERGGRRVGYRGGIPDSGQFHLPGTLGVARRNFAGNLEGEPRLPTPPAPVNVRSRAALRKPMSSATSFSRPKKLVVWAGRLPVVAFKLLSAGNLSFRPFARIW
jgi:hypothetical protein